ncbi:hypothetical protein ZIOFF_008083 [Zingiber officinale]|uniref:Uncharacterized protein n=1 Tax=Zingiber officinale TaxID=94328 RepID=A0A8J5HS67_ZINOF|nr:hypothetical protein ZIOFF_008083 [Zingiber officinale]
MVLDDTAVTKAIVPQRDHQATAGTVARVMTAARRCRWLWQELPEVTALDAGGTVALLEEMSLSAGGLGSGIRSRRRRRETAVMAAGGGSTRRR